MHPKQAESDPTAPPGLRSARRARAALAAGLKLAVLVPLGYVAVLYALQDRIIFPGAASQGAPETIVRPSPGTELLHLATPGGERVVALYGPALSPDGTTHPDPGSRPALVYFYGNAMCLAYAEPEFERFRRLGLNVLIPDYLGYGQSDGKASEQGCRATADTAFQALRDRGFPPERIIAGGWSLGGAVAIDLAARKRVGGLFAFSTFTSIQSMARGVMPLPLPGFLFAHKFDSLEKISRVTCPILLGHGRRDTLVPFRMCGQLARAVQAPLSLVVIDAAEHNDFFDVGGDQIDDAVRNLIEHI